MGRKMRLGGISKLLKIVISENKSIIIIFACLDNTGQIRLSESVYDYLIAFKAHEIVVELL